MYEVVKYPYELNESYEMRKLFVGKYNPATDEEFTDSIRLALVWVNFKFLHCTYPLVIMNHIQSILEHGRGQSVIKKIKIKKASVTKTINNK